MFQDVGVSRGSCHGTAAFPGASLCSLRSAVGVTPDFNLFFPLPFLKRSSIGFVRLGHLVECLSLPNVTFPLFAVLAEVPTQVSRAPRTGAQGPSSLWMFPYLAANEPPMSVTSVAANPAKFRITTLVHVFYTSSRRPALMQPSYSIDHQTNKTNNTLRHTNTHSHTHDTHACMTGEEAAPGCAQGPSAVRKDRGRPQGGAKLGANHWRGAQAGRR